jgi:pimeloyl-ACP methyl ester carboxylesterase
MTTTATDRRATQPAVVAFHRAPPPVRAAFGILERVAPGLGGLWARRIWFTLPRRNGRPAPPDREPGATFTIRAGDTDVVGEVWGQGPPVLCVHGWTGHRGQFDAFVAPLVARGYRVVTFDGPSHGESPAGPLGPRSSSLPEFVTAMTAVAEAYGPLHAVVGHSMGATAAALALRDGVRPARIAMLAPVASMSAYSRRLVAALGGGDRVHERLAAAFERRIGRSVDSFEVPPLAAVLEPPPTLVVHDEADPSIPVADGAAIAAAWPGARLSVTRGLGHRRIVRDPHVVAQVVDFLTAA